MTAHCNRAGPADATSARHRHLCLLLRISTEKRAATVYGVPHGRIVGCPCRWPSFWSAPRQSSQRALLPVIWKLLGLPGARPVVPPSQDLYNRLRLPSISGMAFWRKDRQMAPRSLPYSDGIVPREDLRDENPPETLRNQVTTSGAGGTYSFACADLHIRSAPSAHWLRV
jgi:hypothetical protein